MSRSQTYRRLKTIHPSFVCQANRRLMVKNGNLFNYDSLKFRLVMPLFGVILINYFSGWFF